MSTKKRSSKPEKVAGRSVGTEPSTATTASGPSAALRPRGSGFVSRPLYHDSLCRVCSHPEREAIEDQIAAGLSASKVAELVKEYDAPCPSVRSIRKHRASHMPSPVAAMQAMIQQATEQTAEDLAENGLTITPYSLAAQVMRLGFARIAKGEIKPTIQDTIRAAEVMHKIEQESDGATGSEAILMASLAHILDTARQFVAPDDLPAFVATLDQENPVMRGVMAAGRQTAVLDADSWEDEDIEQPVDDGGDGGGVDVY